MVRLNHLSIQVRDHLRSRDWYIRHFGFTLEIDLSEHGVVGIKDDGDFTLFLERRADGRFTPSCTLTLQVDDVHATHRELSARGLSFEKAPQELAWGYGAELHDPDGYLVRVWDERSMREQGG